MFRIIALAVSDLADRRVLTIMLQALAVTLILFVALGGLLFWLLSGSDPCSLVGIDTCPMEGIQPARYDEILGLKEHGYATVVACPAGYRAADDKYATSPKVRFKHEDVIVRV